MEEDDHSNKPLNIRKDYVKQGLKIGLIFYSCLFVLILFMSVVSCLFLFIHVSLFLFIHVSFLFSLFLKTF